VNLVPQRAIFCASRFKPELPALSSVVFVGVEIEKTLVRRDWLYASP
jgi:hypothetical protein